MTVLTSPADLATLADPTERERVTTYARRLVGTAFEAESTERQADRDKTKLSLSGLGGCTRAAAYSIAGTPASDVPAPEEAREAILGTWLHDKFLPRLAQTAGPGSVFEERVTLTAAGLVIPGWLDFAQAIRWGAFMNAVWDLKSVKEWRLAGVRRLDGAYTAHWLQVMGYALARRQAGEKVDWVIWLYMDRSTGEIHVEVDEFTNRAMLAVIARVETIVYWATDPDHAPREVATVGGRHREYATMRGPGLSFACDRCPWLRRCWGPTAVPRQKGAQTILAATPAGVEQALEMYAHGQEMESAGKKDKEFAKLVLSATPDNVYGNWKLSHGSAGEMTDNDAVEAHYAEIGQSVPKKYKAGAISVKRTPQGEA